MWINWEGSFEQIDDSPSDPGADADYARTLGAAGESVAWYRLSEMPDNFQHMTTLDVRCRVGAYGLVDDGITLYCQLYREDFSTPLTDELSLGWITAADNGTFRGVGPVQFAGVARASKPVWDFAYLRVRTWYTDLHGHDGGELRMSALELSGVYQPTLAVGIAAAIAGVTPPSLVISGARDTIDAAETCTILPDNRTCVPLKGDPGEQLLHTIGSGMVRFSSDG